MPSKQKGPVFRVTGLPVERSNEGLNTALWITINDNLSNEERSRLTFTLTVVVSCYDDLEMIALVEFHGGVPGFLSALVANPLEDWQIEMGDIDINFDQHFFGFTQLYTPKSDAPVTADIIAITGLDGHAYGSWRGKGNLGRMWLRDFLSKDLPYCRTMIYGYNSKLSTHGIDTILDYGRELIEELKKVRNTDELRQRPLFFIAHSFGGIILAHCLVKAVQTNEDDNPTMAALHRATYGMLLFGIPHKGLVVDDIQKMLAGEENHPRRTLLQQIRDKSDLLAYQLADFKNLIRDRKIISFYETGQTRELEFNNQTKRWERTGCFITAVDTDSALLQLPDCMEEKIPLDSDHSLIVKFDNKNSRGYTSARDKLKSFEQDAPAVVAARFLQCSKQSAGAKFLVPYTENSDFVNRPDIVEKLKSQFPFGQRQSTATRKLRVSLQGLGGVGKTQIALAYVYWLRGECPDVSVFWIHASNRERFRQGYASIAAECNIPGHDDPGVDVLILVKYWLEKHFKSRWLMVIDNADDAQLFFHMQEDTTTPPHEKLSRYIPECAHGSILVTTRNKKAGSKFARGKAPIEVGNMTNDEANQLMRTILENDEIHDEETSGLASRLENLPLALAQAASFIHENGITIHDYIGLLDASDVALVECLSESFEAVGRDSDTPHAVAATWIISFEQIEKEDRFTGEVLSLISLFDRQAIPREFITSYWQKESTLKGGGPFQEVKITKALGTLKAFCFVLEAKDESLDVHRLVQLVARKWLVIKGNMTKYAQHAIETVSDAFPYGQFETRELCLRYLPHAYAVLKYENSTSKEAKLVKARLLHNVAGYFHYEGNWKEAEQCVVLAVVLKKEILGEKHPDTLTSMSNLASTHRSQGRWKEAEELEMEVLETRKSVLGEENPDTLTSMSNLASTHRSQGRWKEAEELEMDVMAKFKTALGEEHPHTLTSMGNLALTYSNQGRWNEAEELMVQVMAIRKRVLGEEHPDTLTSMSNLASTYSNQGRWKEAEEREMDVMAKFKTALGEEHPHTLTSMGNLALTYSNQGRWKEAEELMVQVMAIRKRVQGEEHPNTLMSMANLASTYSNQGRWKEAEELMVQVMAIKKRVLGEEHPHTLTSMGNLALTYSNQGRWKEAEELMVQVMAIRKRVLGEEHPDTLMSMANLASTYSNQGCWKEAEELMVQVMAIRKRVLGEEHPDTLTSMANLASTYSNQGRWKEAEQLMVQVMAIRKRVLGEEHPDTLTSMSNLASTYRHQGRWKESENLEVDVTAISKRVLGKEHPHTLTSMGNLTLIYWNQGHWKKAEELGMDAVTVFKRVLGEEHPHTLASMVNLASIYRDQWRWKEAEELEMDVMAKFKTALGEEHPHTLTSMGNLALTYSNQGRWKEAEELMVQVMAIRKRVQGEEHPDTLTSMSNLASTYSNQGRWKEAEQLMVQVMAIRKRVLGEEHPDMLTSMANLALTYSNQGRWKEAEQLMVQVMAIRKRVLGEEHPDTLMSMGNLASVYRSRGHWKKAEELGMDTVTVFKRVLGEEHPHTLTSMGNLALTYSNQGRWKEAEEREMDVMAKFKTALGEEHPHTLTSMGNLALTYSNQGRWKEAEELMVQVMAIRKRVLGEEHPDTLMSMANLASTYSNQGCWKEAEELMVQVMAIRKRVLGEEHPDTLMSMANLASTYSNQGCWKEAEGLGVEVLEIRKSILGEGHPDTLTSMANLAFTWKGSGQVRDALDLMRRCAVLRQAVLGVDHPQTMSSVTSLALWDNTSDLLLEKNKPESLSIPMGRE